MPTFTSSTFGTYTRKVLIAVGVFEVLLASGFIAGGVLAGGTARSGLILTGVIMGVVAVPLILFGARVGAKADEAARIDATGLAGQATLTGLTQTGMFLNENPQVRMDLQVEVPGRAPYAAERTEFVPLILLGRLTVGAALPVKVDQADPQKVVIDWDAPPGMPTPGAAPWGTSGAGATPWGTSGVGAPAAAPGDPETMTAIQAALQQSGLAAPQVFGAPQQGGSTLEQLRAHVRQFGVSGTATIENLEDSGRIVGNERLFTTVITVEVPGQPPRREGPSATMIPLTAMHKVAVGRKVPIKVAPDNPSLLMFEWDRV